MNSDTGQIRAFENSEQARKAGFDTELKGKPKSNCKKCSGLGHVGRNIDTGKYDPCTCCK